MTTTHSAATLRRSLAAGCAAAALLLTACGGDGGETADRERADTTQDAGISTPTADTSGDSTPDSGPAETAPVETTTPATTAAAPETTAAPVTADTSVDTTFIDIVETTTAIDAGEVTEAELVALFEDYRSALLARDGATGATYVSASTLSWYGELAEHSRSADEAAILDTLSISDALSVLAFRGSLDRELLLGADGRSLIIVGIEEGLVGDNVAAISLSDVTVDGDEAVGTVDGDAALFYVRDPDGWKLDLQAITAQLDSFPEAQVIFSLSGGAATTRAELFELIATGLGTDLDTLLTPLT